MELKYYKQIGGKRFTLMGAHKSRTEADSAAKFLKATGFNSRVVKSKTFGYLVYNGALKHPEKMTWRNR